MTNNRILTKFQPNECQQKMNFRTTRTMLTAKKMNYLVLVHCATCGLHCNASCANIQEFLLSTSLSRSNMGEKTTPEIHVLTRHKSHLKKNIYLYHLVHYICKCTYVSLHFTCIRLILFKKPSMMYFSTKEYDIMFSKTAC